jgi:hypothetical protein
MTTRDACCGCQQARTVLRSTFEHQYAHLPYVTAQPGLFDAGRCFPISDEQLQQYPTIHLHLLSSNNTVIVASLTAEQYLMPGTTVLGRECRFMGVAENTGNNAYVGTILGNVFMQAFDIVFDRDTKQIGLAPAGNCTAGAFDIRLLSESNDALRVPVGQPITIQVLASFLDTTTTKAVVGLIVEFIEDIEVAQLAKTSMLNGAAGAATNASGIATITFTLLYAPLHATALHCTSLSS